MGSNSGIPVCGKYCRVPGTVSFHGKLVPIFAVSVRPSISTIQDITRALHQLFRHFWRSFLDISSYHTHES